MNSFVSKKEKELGGEAGESAEVLSAKPEEERTRYDREDRSHPAETRKEDDRPADIYQDKKREKSGEIKISVRTKLRGAVFGTVKMSESDIEGLIDTLSVSMLKSDVAQDTTEKFTESLSVKLKDSKFDYKNMRGEILDDVRDALLNVLNSTKKGIDILSYIKDKPQSARPVKILFLGPNGTGKTTTIAKLAYMLKGAGMSSVMSASDTFRAAAIEQTEHHAMKVGVPVIKSSYGADPASVAYDAIEYAKAHRIDVVLIDTAGRQETNKNLIMEVQKMVRVAKPDLTIFVGESTSGNVISRQIAEFNKSISIDGIILTKLDCDAKGGSVISIADVTGIPILLFGNGEGYGAIVRYDPNFIVDSILPRGEI